MYKVKSEQLKDEIANEYKQQSGMKIIKYLNWILFYSKPKTHKLLPVQKFI